MQAPENFPMILSQSMNVRGHNNERMEYGGCWLLFSTCDEL